MLEFLNTLDRNTQLHIADYRTRFNATDKSVRKHIDVKKLIEPMNTHEKEKVKNSVIVLRKLTDWKQFNMIPWKVCKSTEDLENNLPHTHGDLIFLPNNFDSYSHHNLARILFHEKVHIYQRLFPKETTTLYTNYWNLTPFKYEIYSSEYARTNPDNSRLLYQLYNPIENAFGTFEATYTENASSLTDVHYTFKKQHSNENTIKDDMYFNLIYDFNINQYEHPNETMACMLTHIAFDNVHHPPTMAWIHKYLRITT